MRVQQNAAILLKFYNLFVSKVKFNQTAAHIPLNSATLDCLAISLAEGKKWHVDNFCTMFHQEYNDRESAKKAMNMRIKCH